MRYISMVLFAALCVTSQAQSFENVLKPDFNALYPNQHKVKVYDSLVADVQESGLSYVYQKQLYYAIDDEGGAQLQSITFDYDPLSAWVEIRRAIIIRKDGKHEVIDSTNVYDYPQPARMIYWGARQKMVEAGKLNAGDALYIELFRKGFTYALLQTDDDKYIPPMRGHYYDIVKFQESFPVHRKVFQTSIPASKQVRFQTFNANFMVDSVISDKKKYTFTLNQIVPVPHEPNMVGLEDVEPKVLITTSPNWEAKSKWFYGVNEDFGSFESTPEIDKKVAEIVKGATSELDTITRLTQWVSDEIRYSGISMGEGEGYTLHTGDMTFTDRCGVCKDKAGMLITMLRAAGFESYAAMTMAGSRIEDIPADQFNHSITVVKRRNGQYELLDPTWVPFVRELWSSREQQQNYLMGLPDGADLMITNISDPKNHYLHINNNAQIDEMGNLTGTIEISAEGQSDASVRGMFTRAYRSQWQNNLQKQLLDIFPQAVIKNITYTDPYGYRDNPVKIVYEYSIPNFALFDGNLLYFNSLTNKGFMRGQQFGQHLSTTLEQRNYNYRIGCSQYVKIVENYSFYRKVKRIESIGNENIETNMASANVSWDKGKTNVSMTFETSFKQREYEASTWPDVKNVLNAIHTFQNNGVFVELK